MADKNLVPGRYAKVSKETGKVVAIANMQGGAEPQQTEDQAERYDLVNVSADVAVGMTRSGSGFAYAEGDQPPAIENPHDQNRFVPLGDKNRKLVKPDTGIKAPPQPKGMTARQAVLGSTTEPRTVRHHPTKTGTPAGTSNKEPSEKTKARGKHAA